MRTLHLYLTRQILATLGMTVLVFTFVLVLANVLREILTLLISGEASLLVWPRRLASCSPGCWPSRCQWGC
jgi:lipopolysaccharide export LptBFGC system permease protein LptF